MRESKLRKKLFWTFFLLISVPLPIFFIIGIKGIVPYMEKTEMRRMIKESTATVGDVQATLRGFKSDLLILSESNEIKNLLEARFKAQEAPYRKAVTQLFVSFAKHRGIYYQIRYINEKGIEIVRVDDAVPVPEELLQDKSDRYYFKEGIKCPKGIVYISPLDLNKERGKIEVPFRPVIRYAATVFDAKSVNKGIVITNVDARQILQRLHGSGTIGSEAPMLVDNEGYYLLHSDKKKEWGGPDDLNTGENIRKDYAPDMVKSFLSGNADILLQKRGIYSFAPIFPNSREEKAWIFVQSIPVTEGIKTVNYLKTLIIIITIASAVAGTYLSYVLSKWLAGISSQREDKE